MVVGLIRRRLEESAADTALSFIAPFLAYLPAEELGVSYICLHVGIDEQMKGEGSPLDVVSEVAAAVSAPELTAMLTPVLVALVGITAGTLYQKRFCPAFDLRTGSVIQFVPCLIVSALVASQTETMLITWSGPFMFALGWLVLVLSVGAISLLNLLIRSGSAVNVASLFYLTPPTTALIAWGVFGETLTGLALAGMAITVFGVWLARK